MKNKIKYIFIVVLIICIIYSLFNIVFRHGTELYLNSEKRTEIKEFINNEYNNVALITKIKIRILLGDAELSLYTGPILIKKVILNDEDPLINYVIDNGIDTDYSYISLITLSIIGLIICSVKNKEN